MFFVSICFGFSWSSSADLSGNSHWKKRRSASAGKINFESKSTEKIEKRYIMNHVSAHLPKRIGSILSVTESYKSMPEITDIDWCIYEHPTSQCLHSPADIPLTERCSALKRLCTASLHFDAIKCLNMEEMTKKMLWVEFNEELYRNALEDTIHLVTKHDNDIQQIQREWTEQYGLPKCSISECTKTERHYSRDRRERKKKRNNGEEDALYAFYQSVHDRAHHFLFHLFDIGMRVETQSVAQGAEDEEEKEPNSEGVAVDKLFAAERDQIRTQREEYKVHLDRLKEGSNKFTIHTVSEQEGKGGVTLMDALFQKLSENIKVQEESLHRLRVYLEDNSFDSECIEIDIEDIVDSNISNLVQNQAVLQTMAGFIRSTNSMVALSLYFCGPVVSSTFCQQ